MVNRDQVAAYLDAAGRTLVALAYDFRENRLWEGDLDRKLAEVQDWLRKVPRERP